ERVHRDQQGGQREQRPKKVLATRTAGEETADREQYGECAEICRPFGVVDRSELTYRLIRPPPQLREEEGVNDAVWVAPNSTARCGVGKTQELGEGGQGGSAESKSGQTPDEEQRQPSQPTRRRSAP